MSDFLDRVAEKAATDPKLAKIINEAKEYGALKEHPGWVLLFERIKAQKAKFWTSLSKRQMSGSVVPQREIDYNRGFYDGAYYVAAHPEKAMASLERASKLAYFATLDDVDAEALADSPFKIEDVPIQGGQ